MHIFLTGANGWIGSAVSRDLLAAGHRVTGLVRTPEKAALLAAAGVTPLLGAVGDLDVIRAGVGAADGIIHLAFGIDFSKIAEMAEEDTAAINAFGEVFAGSDRPIVVVGGFAVRPDVAKYTEDDRPAIIPEFPRASEQTAFQLAASGLRASVVRLPRSVHGMGETHGFVPMLAQVARAKGFSAFVGDGANQWPSVHRVDAARVFRLALERGTGNEAYHAVAEEGIAYRDIAEAIGRQLGVPARSLTPDEAAAHFGPLAMWVAGNGPASSAHTRAVLGWSPREPGLIADIERPDYSS